MRLPEVAGRRLARLATDAVVRRPALWRVFRPLLRAQFDGLAPVWDRIVSPGHLDALLAALEGVAPPRRALDLGTGTGAAAVAVAERFPEAEMIGIDLSPAMVEVATAKLTDELRGRVRFRVGDAAALPVEDGSCELVTLANMIPFPDELARVLAPGGTLVVAFSRGAETPIYVASERLRDDLAERGFADFAEFFAGPGTALRARRS